MFLGYKSTPRSNLGYYWLIGEKWAFLHLEFIKDHCKLSQFVPTTHLDQKKKKEKKKETPLSE